MKSHSKYLLTLLVLLTLTYGLVDVVSFTSTVGAQRSDATLPSESLKFGAFTAQFDPAGSYTIQGAGWPKMSGTWKGTGSEIEIMSSPAPPGCMGPGRYRVRMEGNRVGFEAISDDCRVRKLIIDGSTWGPATETRVVPLRLITRTGGSRISLPRTAKSSKGNWPSFRGPEASGISEGQNLPDKWDPKTGENVLWRTAIPGLAHSSPVVWGNRIYLTTAEIGRAHV